MILKYFLQADLATCLELNLLAQRAHFGNSAADVTGQCTIFSLIYLSWLQELLSSFCGRENMSRLGQGCQLKDEGFVKLGLVVEIWLCCIRGYNLWCNRATWIDREQRFFHFQKEIRSMLEVGSQTVGKCVLRLGWLKYSSSEILEARMPALMLI